MYIVREGDCIDFLFGFIVFEILGYVFIYIFLYREFDGILIGGDVFISYIFLNLILELLYEG